MLELMVVITVLWHHDLYELMCLNMELSEVVLMVFCSYGHHTFVLEHPENDIKWA